MKLNKILNFKNNNKRNDKVNEDRVPDHVFLGLIFGTIRGPLIKLPNIYAKVSFIKDKKINV